MLWIHLWKIDPRISLWIHISSFSAVGFTVICNWRNHPGKIREIEGKYIAGGGLFLSQLARARREKRKKKGRKNKKRITPQIGVCLALNFPRENHLIPQPRSLFLQTGMKYLFAYASPGLWTPGKVNNDLKFSRRHLRWRRRSRIAERTAFLR